MTRGYERYWDDLFGWEGDSDEIVARYLALLDRLQGEEALERIEDGRCDDCGRLAPRYRYGRLALCLLCARPRRRVAAEIRKQTPELTSPNPAEEDAR